MPFTEKRLAGPTQLTTGATALYTVPANRTTIVKQVVATNTSASAATFTLYIGTAVAANAVFNATSVAANDSLVINLSQVLSTGEVLRALASANTAINLTISGVENDGPLTPTATYIADGAVTSAKIADGTIVNADINASAAIDKTKISGTAITAADTGTVTSTMILDGTIATADIANNAVTQAKLDTAIPLSGFRNAVMNGSFDIWQRGAGAINTTGGGASNYSADRWRFSNNGTASQYNITRVTNTSDAPTAYALRLTSARTTDSLNGLEYLMEYADVVKLKSSILTLSFWVRASTNTTFTASIDTGTLTTDVYPGVGNGLTGASSIASSSVSATTSWQRITITSSAVPSNAGQLRIILVNAIALTNGVWLEFAGVQLEKGSQVTPFEQRPYGVELLMCQRYYQRHNFGGSYFMICAPIGTTNGLIQYSLPVPMRVAPTFVASSGSALRPLNTSGSITTTTDTGSIGWYSSATPYGGQVYFSGSSGLTAGVVVGVYNNNNSYFEFTGADL